MAHRLLDPTKALEFTSFAINEVYIDLDREALLHIAKDASVLKVRVQTFGPNGRPTSRTLRLPVDLLREPDPHQVFGPDDPFN